MSIRAGHVQRAITVPSLQRRRLVPQDFFNLFFTFFFLLIFRWKGFTRRREEAGGGCLCYASQALMCDQGNWSYMVFVCFSLRHGLASLNELHSIVCVDFLFSD